MFPEKRAPSFSFYMQLRKSIQFEPILPEMFSHNKPFLINFLPNMKWPNSLLCRFSVVFSPLLYRRPATARYASFVLLSVPQLLASSTVNVVFLTPKFQSEAQRMDLKSERYRSPYQGKLWGALPEDCLNGNFEKFFGAEAGQSRRVQPEGPGQGRQDQQGRLAGVAAGRMERRG